MNSENDEHEILTTKDIVTTTASAGAAATSAIVVDPTAATSVLALAAVLVAVFPPVLALMTEAGARRMKARADRFFRKIVEDWARDGDKTHEEVAAQLEDAKEDPKVTDTIWRAVRGLMEAPNDEVAIPLGVLAAEYMRDRRPADAFFRGVVRLLQELEAEEFQELRALLTWLTSATKRDEVEVVARDGGVDAALDEFASDPGVDGEPEKRTRMGVASDPDRLFALLTANGLAVSYPGMRWDAGLPEIRVRRAVATRLLRLLSSASSG